MNRLACLFSHKVVWHLLLIISLLWFGSLSAQEKFAEERLAQEKLAQGKFVQDKQAKAELPELHHRSNILMPESMQLPQSLFFAEVDNRAKKIVCKTCHGIEDIQDKDFKQIDKQRDDFLRNGPYEPLTDFCYLCHEKKKNQRENIHILLDNTGDKKEQQCLYCHTEVLKQDQLLATDSRHLRLPAEKICFGCHLRTPHLNALEHQGQVSDEMLEHMQNWKVQNDVSLPLTKKNQISCVTCHDPHQQGVLKANNKKHQLRVGSDLETGVSYESHPWAEVYAKDKYQRLLSLNLKSGKKQVLQYQRIKNEVLLRLPAKNGELCLACHNFSKERIW